MQEWQEDDPGQGIVSYCPAIEWQSRAASPAKMTLLRMLHTSKPWPLPRCCGRQVGDKNAFALAAQKRVHPEQMALEARALARELNLRYPTYPLKRG